ncbi:MAG: type II/IV secretion system protein [Candidatus Aureabacteria bacterium]|nr:type II/IV secretion system protein [Candidatus Auribacterota bacterium]
MKALTYIRHLKENDLDLKTIRSLDERFFHIQGICPVSMKENSLFLAASESFSEGRVLDNLKKALRKKLCLLKADEDSIFLLKKRIFSHMAESSSRPEEPQKPVDFSLPAEDLKVFTGDLSDIVKLANKIIIQGYHEGATDIHIQKVGNTPVVRFRIDGMLHDALRFDIEQYDSLLTRLKVMARLDIAQTHIPQSGRSTVKINQDTVSLRLSTLPSRSGEKVSVRFLYGTQDLLSIEELGLSGVQMKTLLSHMKGGKGIFIVGGPTGCGKTTTLYSIIRQLNDGTQNIITLEDPPEIDIGGRITQVQVGLSNGLTFNDGIRSILRHDPDVILIGEIRDKESARAAFEAALTGHLVLTTVHMPTVMDILDRLEQMEIDPLTIHSSIIGVATQRLVRRICPSCSTRIKPKKEAVSFFSEFGLRIEQDMSASGCMECRTRGYRGRQGIFDIRLTDDDAFPLRLSGHQKTSLKRKEKYSDLAYSALEAIHSGATSSEEVMRSLW